MLIPIKDRLKLANRGHPTTGVFGLQGRRESVANLPWRVQSSVAHSEPVVCER